MTTRYLLGHSPRETKRLAAQARLWDPVSHALFDRLRIRPGQRVLELGPGMGSLHAELRRRVRGPIDAVEQSPVYAEATAKRVARDGFGEGQWFTGDLKTITLPRVHYDIIFARWVFLFLPNAPHVLRRLRAALRPGGKLVVQDYCRDTLAMVPMPPEWPAFVKADAAFFASRGGNVNAGGVLPTQLRKAGMNLLEVTPHTLSGHPGSDVWDWLSTYFLGVLPSYAKLAPFSPIAAAALRRTWLRAAKQSTSLLIAPTVLDIVAQRPRS